MQRQRHLGPFVVGALVQESHRREFAAGTQDVVFGVGTGIHLLVDHAAVHGPVLVGLPAQRGTAPRIVDRVDVVLHELGIVEGSAEAVASTLSMKPASRAEKPTTRIATFSPSGMFRTPETS